VTEQTVLARGGRGVPSFGRKRSTAVRANR